jgi:hypothetical protein
MPWTTHLLVVASRTAQAPELVEYLRGRARTGPLTVTLLVPVESGGREAARERMQAAVARLREAGVEASGAVAGDGDALHGVLDAYDRSRHDEIVIVTMPEHLSRWLGCDLPQRVAQMTGALVRHVETRTAPAAPAARQAAAATAASVPAARSR